jgi:hypothetical protein
MIYIFDDDKSMLKEGSNLTIEWYDLDLAYTF